VFYVYALYSVTERGFYIAYSIDLKRRLWEHNQGASIATRHPRSRKLMCTPNKTTREDENAILRAAPADASYDAN